MGIYILNHTHAALIYVQSSGLMPATDLQTLSDTLRTFHNRGSDNWVDSSIIQEEVFPTHNQKAIAAGNCLFLYYLGLLFRKKEGRSWVWKLNSYGDSIANLIDNNYDLFKLEIRKRLFDLEFIRVLVSFLMDYPNSDSESIQSRLGNDMNEFGIKLAKIGIAKLSNIETMMKPFNKAVLPSILKLLEDLEIIKKDQDKIKLLSLSREEINKISKNFDDLIIWTNNDEQIILASLIDVLERQEFIKIISPHIQKQILEKLNELNLIKGKTFQIITNIKKMEEIPSNLLNQNLEALKFLKNISNVQVKYNEETPIHANLIASNKCATIMSSNLTDPCLLKNIELGTAYFNKNKINQIVEFFDNLWSDPAFYSLDLNFTG